MPYVIVTTRDLAPAFAPLAAWKTRTGLPADVVTVEAIAADPTIPGNDLPEKIRSFLRRAHENWHTRWVCLGGHVTEVPARGTYMRRGEHSAAGNISDLYFGDVLPENGADEADVEVYNWNGDGDGKFGELKDGMDLLPEMYVARLPFRTGDQVKDYLKKYFAYVQGKEAEAMGRALVIGAEEFGKRQESLAEELKKLGAGKDAVVDTLVEVPVPKIVEEIDKGFGILDIFGHGCPHHMWLGEKRSHFGVKQIRTLANGLKCGIVYSQGCSANDYRKWESMGVAFLVHPKGGAVAYTGYTATSFGSPVNRAFYELVWSGAFPQIGRAMAEAKKRMIGDRWMVEYLNTLGEPEMWVWTAKPETMKVEGDLKAGLPLTLRVLGPDDAPVKGARLCLAGKGLYLAGESDDKGVVRLSGAAPAGRVQVFAMAQNRTPFEGSLRVERSEHPVWKGPKWIVDDDGEGESRGNGRGDIGPDETVELRLKWPVAPEKGTVRIETEDPFVEVVKNEFPVEKEDGAFLLKVKGNVRPGHVIWLTARLSEPGTEGTWTWRERFPVQGPSIRCVGARIEDRKGNKDGRLGWEDAGAELGMHVTLYNRGNRPARDPVLRLECKDADVKMECAEIRQGDLKPYDSVETRKPFSFGLAGDYDGHALEFLLTVEEKAGGTWKALIRVSIPPAPPILLEHTASPSYVVLTWRPGGTPGVHGYNVYRGSRRKGPFKKLTDKPVRGMTVFRDQEVKSGKEYYYVVTSVTAEGMESVPSKPQLVRTLSALWGKKR